MASVFIDREDSHRVLYFHEGNPCEEHRADCVRVVVETTDDVGVPPVPVPLSFEFAYPEQADQAHKMRSALRLAFLQGKRKVKHEIRGVLGIYG